MDVTVSTLREEISSCRICEERFASTHTGHEPRPVVWFRENPRILICGQAPGMRVYSSGVPFDDPSGDRLRDWMEVSRDEFYDLSRIAIIPMAFCFPGYDAKGSDLPPPRICAETWHGRIMRALPEISLILLVGGYAHRWHLRGSGKVTETVSNWRDHAPRIFPLPHPSWRNTGWLKRNPWFELELLPVLRRCVRDAMKG